VQEYGVNAHLVVFIDAPGDRLDDVGLSERRFQLVENRAAPSTGHDLQGASVVGGKAGGHIIDIGR
jgi:hypothetical protein